MRVYDYEQLILKQSILDVFFSCSDRAQVCAGSSNLKHHRENSQNQCFKYTGDHVQVSVASGEEQFCLNLLLISWEKGAAFVNY